MSPVVQETYAFAYMVPNVKHKGVVMWGGFAGGIAYHVYVNLKKRVFYPRNSVSLVIPFTFLLSMPPSHHSYTLWVLCPSCVCLLLDPRCFQWSLHCSFLLFHWFCIILLDAWSDNFNWFSFLVLTSSFSEWIFLMVTYGVTVEFCYHPELWSLFSLQKKHIVLTTLIIFCIAFF